MSVFNVLLRKELREIRRTWRIWVLPAILLFIAITSPILAQITPALVRSLASNQPGVVIELPDPTPLDSYRQFASQLSQIGLLALIITTAGIISSELRSGTAILVLTKPVSRRSFVLAKLAAQLALLTGATILATLVCWVGTLAIFGEAVLLWQLQEPLTTFMNSCEAVMVTGRLYDEATICRIAHAYEQATEWKDRHPTLPA